jgi:zinc/manganese transport system ATP-binding protein
MVFTSTNVGRARAIVAGTPVLQLVDCDLRFGPRPLWRGLTLDVRPGEFVAVLGANGSGKTTLLRAILGLQPLSHGQVLIDGAPPRRGSPLVGYIPQERRLAPPTPLRARDLVQLGVDGAHWGTGLRSAARRQLVEDALASVGAAHVADQPVQLLSGGEQQRVRIAQSLVTDPRLLLCDEPLLSLDLHHQRGVVSLIDARRRTHGTAVIFVTHEINPVLPYVDRVLYLADGRFSTGTVDEVMTSATLSALYDAPVEVLRIGGRLVVAGVPDGPAAEAHHETPGEVAV